VEVTKRSVGVYRNYVYVYSYGLRVCQVGPGDWRPGKWEAQEKKIYGCRDGSS
jgi:hypothetical protein